MKIRYLLHMLVIFLALGYNVKGQENNGIVKVNYLSNSYFDFSGSTVHGQSAGALSYFHLHGIGHKKQRLKIGYGLRFTSYVGANKFYRTAPSKYTSTVQGPGTIFSSDINENIDTIATVTPQVNSMNLSIHIEYNVWRKFDIGFNIDVAGFSFGGRQKVNVISSSFDANQAPVLYARPTKFNLLLTSDNDIGSLNSEFFLRYWLSSKIGIRAGYTFLFTEYTTEQPLSFDHGRIQNDRYRQKSSLFLFAVTWKPFAKNKN
ncbi:MAG TPA: hypothetical protein VNW06_06695 [Cytophagaceae bacterium]|nr:hypothetical protein [Cytophagaceae bacterium]